MKLHYLRARNHITLWWWHRRDNFTRWRLLRLYRAQQRLIVYRTQNHMTYVQSEYHQPVYLNRRAPR